MTKNQDAFWLNWNGLSSIVAPCIHMDKWYGRIQCPNGHYDKTIIERKSIKAVHFSCNVCGRKFWVNEFKIPKSRKK